MKAINLILLFFLFACNVKKPAEISIPEGNSHAHGFSIEEKDQITLLKVMNPWENARNVELNYSLLSGNNAKAEELNAIKVPVSRVICLSTTHVAFLSAIGETDKIVGLSGAGFVSDSAVYKRFKKGEVLDVGYDQNLNYELIVSLKPDVVFAYGVGGEVSGFINRLNDLGIPVVLNAEYLETCPLGKAEWIRFMARFFGKAEMGDSLFSAVRDEYNMLKNSIKHIEKKAVVMTGMPYKDQWWVPGGKAYLANMIEDAGAEYIWKENSSNESFVVPMEKMFAEAERADYWLHTGSYNTLNAIENADYRFARFRPWKNKMVYNNDKRMSPEGGNDYWESGVVKPHLVLNDLIHIFHPGISDGYTFHYYRKIE
jgi:iron complex transport system substrate-binding protein